MRVIPAKFGQNQSAVSEKMLLKEIVDRHRTD